MLKRVTIYSKDNNTKTRDAVQRLVNEFKKRGILVRLFKKPADANSISGSVSIEWLSELNEFSDRPDIILSVGGDGTFLETVLQVKDLGIPVAGCKYRQNGISGKYTG